MSADKGNAIYFILCDSQSENYGYPGFIHERGE